VDQPVHLIAAIERRNGRPLLAEEPAQPLPDAARGPGDGDGLACECAAHLSLSMPRRSMRDCLAAGGPNCRMQPLRHPRPGASPSRREIPPWWTGWDMPA